MINEIEICNVIQNGLTSDFTGGEVHCFLALKPMFHGDDMCFSVKFDKGSEYAQFSHWLKQLLDEGECLKAISVRKRVAMIGRSHQQVNNWYISYKEGGGAESKKNAADIIMTENNRL